MGSSVWTAIPSQRFTIILIGKMKSTFYFILVCGIGGYVADGFLQTGAPSGFVPFGIKVNLRKTAYQFGIRVNRLKIGLISPNALKKIVDGETLLRVINAIIEDIPDICLSKFKMCGGFNEGNQGKPIFPSFWRSMGEEFDLQDDNSTSTNSTGSSHRMRRSTDDYESEYKNEYEGDYDNRPKYGYDRGYDRGYYRGYGYDQGYDRDYGYNSYRQYSYRKPHYYSRGRPYHDHAYDQRFYDLLADFHAAGVGNHNRIWLH